MKNLLPRTFSNYSYITEESIFNDILSKLNDKDKRDLEKVDKLLRKFNKHITIIDILCIVAKLETNAVIIDSALKDTNNDLAFHVSVLNEETQKLIRELFVMLDGKKLVPEK